MIAFPFKMQTHLGKFKPSLTHREFIMMPDCFLGPCRTEGVNKQMDGII